MRHSRTLAHLTSPDAGRALPCKVVGTFLTAVMWTAGVAAVWAIGMAIRRIARRMRERETPGVWGEPPGFVWMWSALSTFIGIGGLVVIATRA